MDRKTLRALVVEYRDEKKWKFTQIAEMLRKEYGIVRDRQSLSGIYARAKNNIEEDKSNIAITADIINLYAMGYNMSEISSMLEKMGETVSYYNIREIIGKEVDYIEDVKNALALKAVDLIIEGKRQSEIKKDLSYKGISPTEKGFIAIMVEAYSIIVLHAATTELVKAYRDVDNREIIKQVIAKTGLQISLTEIKSRA